jgi:hypothetical protein
MNFVTAVGIGVNEAGKAARRAEHDKDERTRAETEARFDAEVEAEKLHVRSLIEGGLALQRRQPEIIAESRAVMVRINDLLRQGKRDEALALLGEAAGIRAQVETINGNHIYGLFSEANQYAELLLQNEAALEALATASVLFRKGNAERGLVSEEFPYWHNLAAGYVELAKLNKTQLREKFSQLFAYLDRGQTRALRPEQMLYALLDDNFDFNLTSETAAGLLDRDTPSWRNFPATHENRDGYAHQNDLSVLDIFELNKLVRVAAQLKTPAMRASIFAARDSDLADRESEHGGIVPRLESGAQLETYPGKIQAGNDRYLIPTTAAMRGLTEPAQFHFHATTVEVPATYHGPSGGDDGYFTPGIVFSSVNGTTVIAHFYVSRERFDEEGPTHRQEVVSLGEIRKS